MFMLVFKKKSIITLYVRYMQDNLLTVFLRIHQQNNYVNCHITKEQNLCQLGLLISMIIVQSDIIASKL